MNWQNRFWVKFCRCYEHTRVLWDDSVSLPLLAQIPGNISSFLPCPHRALDATQRDNSVA